MEKKASGKTYITGKDDSLENSIARMQQQLSRLGFNIEEKTWLHPLPHVWSVHIRDRDCPLLFTNGKGASKKAALASALGEFFERLATNYFWADYYLGDEIHQHAFVHYPDERWFAIKGDKQWPKGLLSEELIRFYDPHQSLPMSRLVDINSAQSERGICALPYIRQRDQQCLYFPVNIIGNLYVSNGMSAGNSVYEARVQALSEIFERYVKFTIIADGLCLPDVPEPILQRYPSIRSAIETLQQNGFSVLVKDASLGGCYPVVNVTLLNPDNQGCYASFGAHPRFEVALERALTELLQGRELKNLDVFPAPVFDIEEVASAENLETHFIDSSGLLSWSFFKNQPDFEFSMCHFEGTTEQEFDWLCQLIQGSDKDIYIADYDYLGLYACRVLVPSMSEIYTCEDLLWENNNSGLAIRQDILSFPSLSPRSAGALLKSLEESDIDDLQPVAALVGLPMQTETVWQDFRIAELKTLLAAISGQREILLQGCQWLLGFAQLEKSRLQLYHCVMNLLEMGTAQEDYEKALQGLYPRTVLKQAKALIQGEVQDFNLMNDWQRLLVEAYQKLHRAKVAKLY